MSQSAVTEYVFNLVAKQVKEHGVVVWYDPEKVYSSAVTSLNLPNTTVARYQGSFFQLRHEIDHLLNDQQPPRLVVYIHEEHGQTNHALVELEAAGVMMQPGQQPPQRNTRLAVVARNALRPILGDETAAEVEKQVESGKLSLTDLDNLASKGKEISTGVLSLIFESANPQDVALAFLSTDKFDAEVEKKSARKELFGLLRNAYDIEFSAFVTLAEARDSLARHILLTDLVEGLGDSLPPALASAKVALSPSGSDLSVSLARNWRLRRDVAFLDRIHFYLPGWEVPKMRIEFFTDHYGFVVDYLAEALRELRRHNFTEMVDHYFSLGSHLNARDVKAVRKTMSGLIKLLYPDGQLTKEEMAELLDLAVEGRRRVKEQLKKMGPFEYYQTSFSYIDSETREERYVGVPEEGGRDLISTDPLAPGSVYTAAVDDQGKVGLYRFEVGCSPGTGKLRVAGGIDTTMKESIHRAFAYIQGHKVNMGIAQAFDMTDFHVEAIDLLVNRISCDAGSALVVAIYSAIKKHPALPALLILGDLSIQGNIKAVRSLSKPLRIGMDNGARRALIPIENKRHFLDVSADIMERVDPIFYGDPLTAAMKALGMN